MGRNIILLANICHALWVKYAVIIRITSYTDETCWKTYASDDFIQVVRDLSVMCGAEIGALPLLLTDPQADQSREVV